MHPIIRFLRTSIWAGLTRSFLLVTLVAVTLPAAVAAVTTPSCGEARFDGTFTAITGDSPYSIYTLDFGTDLGFGGAERDVIQLELYGNGFGASGSFDFSLAPNDNYSSCEICLLVFEDLDTGSQPAKILFQSAGLINISDLTPPGTALELDVAFSGLQVVEVTFDSTTFASTPVPDGACYVPELRNFKDGFED